MTFELRQAAITLCAATCITGWPVAHASAQSIPVRSVADLMLPASRIPSGFQSQARQSFALSTARLAPWTGKMVLTTFQHEGYVAGYHLVLNGPAAPGMQFVAANIFGFKSDTGALLARAAYQHLIVGTPIMYSGGKLPKSAVVWTYAGTAAKHVNYVAARVVFRVANVVGDVTGFYVGSDGTAATTALQDAAAVVNGYIGWLGARLGQTPNR
jgi:hypothetical protein